MLLEEKFAPERAVFEDWARGFEDRDGKFVEEFQMTLESGLWELYLHTALKCLGLQADMSFSSPDFVVTHPTRLTVEATIAAPPQGCKPPHGYTMEDIPSNFTEFNVDASLRICNSFDSKVKRFRSYYSALPHVVDTPFVIAIAAFDRPFAHFAAGRPILSSIYGLYHDEAATPRDASRVVSYNVSAAPKSETVDIPLGLFCDATYADVSAVIYSSLATWGKVRALANNPFAKTIYTTYHPSRQSLLPEVRTQLKSAYSEHLLDGLFVLHNPFAKNPIPSGVLSHPRIAEIRVAPDGELIEAAPDDFLLVRTLMSVVERS